MPPQPSPTCPPTPAGSLQCQRSAAIPWEANRVPLPRRTRRRPQPDAGSVRRDFLARQLNAMCAVDPSARILSVACGDLEEAALSTAVQHQFFGRFVGVDREEQVLAAAASRLGHLGLETVRGAVETILSWPLAEDRFDYIYTDGLYDAFDDRFCRRLTRKLFEMLRPGGRLLIGNALSQMRTARAAPGEARHERTPSAMQRLADDIPTAWRATEIFIGPCEATVYLDLLRYA